MRQVERHDEPKQHGTNHAYCEHPKRIFITCMLLHDMT